MTDERDRTNAMNVLASYYYLCYEVNSQKVSSEDLKTLKDGALVNGMALKNAYQTLIENA